MSIVTQILRNRRRRIQARAAQRRMAGLGLALIVVLGSAIGVALLGTGLAVAHLGAGLPPVEEVEALFGPAGDEVFTPLRIYARDGRTLLYEHTPDPLDGQRWLTLNGAGADRIPPLAVDAILAAIDPTFWENGGYEWAQIRQAIAGRQAQATLTQRLANVNLIPVSDQARSGSDRFLRSALLAAQLTRRYPKERILTWYLNSAHFGRRAYGLEAAAWVSFGHRAADLDLAEAATLAAMVTDPQGLGPNAPEATQETRQQILSKMVLAGVITQAQAERAAAQGPGFQSASSEAEAGQLFPRQLLLREVEAVLGSDLAGRTGLRIVSTLDQDLQLQAICAARSHITRLTGERAGTVVPASQQNPCLAAGLLTPLRPGEIGVDHEVADWALAVIDPLRGEVLSLAGEVDQAQVAGGALTPLTYLAAFSRGYAPSSMVLDLPSDSNGPGEGPIRMRSALANDYRAAGEHVVNLAGVENVVRTIEQMGLGQVDERRAAPPSFWAQGSLPVRMLDLMQAYGVLAAEGLMVGRPERGERGMGDDNPALELALVLEVEDAAGRILYRYEPQQRAVLSPALAYLINDVLSDEGARWPSLGPSNPLEIGRPAAAMSSLALDGEGVWTLGFTPQRVAGVWLGGEPGSPMPGVDRRNASAPIWHAILRYATRDLDLQGWEQPLGVSRIDVCTPSGLLPTVYCPEVVRELFLQGSEPTSFDHLYQPYRLNQETGKLATLFTPLDLIEERVYFVPPPEAADWAAQIGLEQPPQEYDSLAQLEIGSEEAQIQSPAALALESGQIEVIGVADADGFQSYRLQYGPGLDPGRWVQIGQDQPAPVEQGLLGVWDSEGLNGLYTLQLVVVLEGGEIRSAAIPISLDNQAPDLQLESPAPNARLQAGEEVFIEMRVEDAFGVASVTVFVDQVLIARLTTGPYAVRWIPEEAGEYDLTIRARDNVGNTQALEWTWIVEE